jgi:hypothetical protein
LKSFETWRTWVIIIGLLLFAAVASVAWPAIVDSLNLDLDLSGSGRGAGELETALDGIPVPDAVAGLPGISALVDDEERISPWLVLAAISALIISLIVGTGLVLGILFRLLDRQTRQVKADPEFNENAAALAQREKERLQQRAQEQPPTPMPSHERPRWSLVATSLVILFFVLLVGFAVGDTLYGGATDNGGDPVLALVLGLGLAALLVMVAAILLRRGRPYVSNENASISWGVIWVVISGLVFLGIGLGLTLAMRTVEAP